MTDDRSSHLSSTKKPAGDDAQEVSSSLESPYGLEIDPNVRIDNNGTYCGFEDLTYGTPVPAVNSSITVRMSGTNLITKATVTAVDEVRELIYLDVAWESFKPDVNAEIRRWATTLEILERNGD